MSYEEWGHLFVTPIIGPSQLAFLEGKIPDELIRGQLMWLVVPTSSWHSWMTKVLRTNPTLGDFWHPEHQVEMEYSKWEF